MATKTKTAVLMTCPECGATCGMRVDTTDMSVECSECNEEVDPAAAALVLRTAAERWERFGAWLAAAGQV
jgi:peptide subunit release factor 1 (eRF1)